MRRPYFLMLGLLFLSASCTGDERIVYSATARFSPAAAIEFPYQGGTRRVEVKTNQTEWKVTSSNPEWCEVTTDGMTAVITVLPSSYDGRTQAGVVTLEAGTGDNVATATLTVDQQKRPYEDLSADGTANTYIVPVAGRYRFPAGFQGKSDIHTTDNLDGCKAEWVWATGEDLIEVAADLNDEGYITFVTPDVLRPGNVVVALLKEDRIVWTWQIWITDKVRVPDSPNYMNVNLGAVDDTPGSAGAMGLYYQWGRKDPIIGASGTGGGASKNESAAFAEGDVLGEAYTARSYINPRLAAAWSVDSSGKAYTHAEAAAAPTTFMGEFISLPAAKDSKWPVEADPCPPGWHMPTMQEMVRYVVSYTPDFEEHNGGVVNGMFFPATGYRHTYMPTSSNGQLWNLGRYGFYWTSTQREQGFGTSMYFSEAEIIVATTDRLKDNQFMKSYGFAVRCFIDETVQ